MGKVGQAKAAHSPIGNFHQRPQDFKHCCEGTHCGSQGIKPQDQVETLIGIKSLTDPPVGTQIGTSANTDKHTFGYAQPFGRHLVESTDAFQL